MWLHEGKHFTFLFFVSVQMLEHQMEVREKEVQSLQTQAVALSQEDAGLAEIDGQQKRVIDNFSSLQDPLDLRRQKLLASKEAHQFNRDLEDEIVSRASYSADEDEYNFLLCVLYLCVAFSIFSFG